MDFGIVGNCHYSALVDNCGEVVWLCWPRFDASFVFGSLLDSEKGGTFRISPADDQKGVQSYIINTNLLRTEFEGPGGRFEVIDFAPRFFQYDRYFKPTMLIRIVRPLAGEPLVKVNCRPVYEYGLQALSPVFGSNHINYAGTPHNLRLTTNASLSLVQEGRAFVLDKTHYFALTYGQPLESSLQHTCEEFYDRTINYWQRWVKHCRIPRRFQRQVIRSALVLKLHQFEDTGAIIAATTTSIPEAAGTERNWDYRYCWLRDALFSLVALQRLTQFEELEGFVSYLRNLVETARHGGGLLQPVYGLAGEEKLTEQKLLHLQGYRGFGPVRVGNQAHEHKQHDVYGEMVLAIGQLFLDHRFANETNKPPIGLLEALIDQIEKHILAKDAGLWEFRGIAQLHTFTLLCHWAGASRAHEIGEACGYEQLAARAKRLQQQSAAAIDQRCWHSDVGAFTQAAGQKHLDASLLQLINLGFLPKDDPRAWQHLQTTVQGLMAENGMIHRYINPDDFGATDNVFTICSFWLAEAYCRLGHQQEAEALFEKLCGYANNLGLYSEDIDPKTHELWGNFPQTYSHVGLINAAFAISHNSGDGHDVGFDVSS